MTTKTLTATVSDVRAAGWGEYLSAGLVTLGIVVALLI